MALPKKIKKTIDLIPKKTGLERRIQLLDDIQKDGTYLPKGIGHADLDRGMLDFVKNDLKTFMDGKVIPTVDIIITTQNWSQFTETWNFQDLDKNVKPPFVSTVRQPEVPYGSNPSLQYTIPNRKQFYYAKVPTWDGQRKGMDVYKIPQPIPVDITYNVKLFVNRMRSLNEFNKNVLQNFSSRQAYTTIKGHYIPIILNNISDESVMDIDKRKYYIQNYEFTMLGFLMDEDEFEVSPGISRALTMFEIPQLNKSRKVNPQPENPNEFPVDLLFVSGNTELSETFRYTADLHLNETFNVSSFSVYINNDYVGDNISKIQVNTNDLVKFIVTKESSGESQIFTTAKLL
tara:strand:- start:963 stop:2000 length:1038 start_codon:yes stop_codon:yes gene_type:complete